MKESDQFDDIPGTYLFDRNRSREGYHVNMFCMSLMKPENREAFRANEAEYLNRFPMTPEQRRAILERDWLGMIKLGANIYYTSKLGATDGKSFQYLAGAMSGLTQEQYRDMMIAGGRSIEGNRSKSEKK
ncbi:MAG TPA: protocatechuate 4,5-dioxygenase subunit alpha [Gammaproteobacteria bacterium]|nr:protocatechuate 4,5-dioxygenase subunit alpha [Gammaproteobacteria bacterium]